MSPSLHSARLVLRPLELADAKQTQQLFPHWEIVRFLSRVPWPYPENGALQYFRDVALPAIERGDSWQWTLRLKRNPQQLIGLISLTRDETKNRGFWLGLPWHGQGLMTEAADVATDYWFNQLGFSVMRIPKAVANIASRRISEKQGMRVVAVEEKDYVGGRFLTEIWQITAEEWRARRRKQML